MRIIDNDAMVGLSIRDLRNIMAGRAATENANLANNPETKHKQIADLVSKDFYLKMLPEELATLHMMVAYTFTTWSTSVPGHFAEA